MIEKSLPNPDQLLHQQLRPFGELLAREIIVYHGIGTDILAVTGVASKGLMSAVAQQEELGTVNTNSTGELAKNGDSHVSVAKAPQTGFPNQAFMTYIEQSPISFAIDSSKINLTQPADRGFFDEAFIDGATDDDIVGIVVDSNTADSPVAELPIVTGNITADAVVAKSRAYLDLLTKLDPSIGVTGDELEERLAGIKHIDLSYLQATWGQVSDSDKKKIDDIDQWLRTKLATALTTRFGSADMSVLEMVKLNFPDKELYLNDHSSGIKQFDEREYFATLPSQAKIGYEKFDGTADGPSTEMLRRANPFSK